MFRHPLPRTLRGTFFVALFASLLPAASAQSPALELKHGDRISLVGNTLADRMQHDGWLETYLLSRFPKHDLVFRNLGFSGDELTVRFRSQSFGSPNEWLTKTKTDVVFAFFGHGESFAGEKGIDGFKKDLTNFVVDTKKQKYNGTSSPRIVLFSPIAHENLKSPHMPDGAADNKRLELYTEAMAEVAKANDVAVRRPLPSEPRGVRQGVGSAHDQRHPSQRSRGRGSREDRRPRSVPEGGRAEARDRDPRPDSQGRPRAEQVLVRTLPHHRRLLDLRRPVEPEVRGRADQLHGHAARDGDSRPDDRQPRPGDLGRRPGDAYKVDDSNLPPYLPVVTNKPGKGPGGEHIYLDGREAIKLMTPGKNLKVNLVASEKEFPDLADPVQMSFDPQGRLWVAVWPSYPHWKPGDEMNDKLIVLDLDPQTGAATKMTVFADKLHNPTGFEFWNGGVLVAQAPGLVFLKDTTGNGKADLRVRVLDGFDTADTHHTANSFVLDPGGALYFQEGTFHQTQIETPWGPTVRNSNAGVYRYEPRTQKIETYINFGFANPHGHVFDRWGQDIVVDGTGSVPTHATLFSGQTEGYQQRHGGPPHVYKQKTRPCAGTEILSSKHFPESFQGNFLNCNVIGFQGILRYQILDKGASFVGKELEPIVSSTDPNFRPSDVRTGPDGAIYFLDWQNPIIGHMQHNLRDPSRNHTHGRIYRVSYEGRPLSPPVKIAGEPIVKLLDNLKQPEDRVRYRTRLELTGRPTADVIAATNKWIATLDPKDADYEHHMTEALWLHQSHDVVDEALLTRMLRSPDFHARAAATHVLSYWRDRVKSPLALLKRQINDESPRVRLEAIRALSFFRGDEPLMVAAELLKHPTDEFLDYTFNETLNTLERRSGGKAKGGKANITAFFLDMLSKPDMPAEQRATLVESIVRSGGANELRTIFQRVQAGNDPVAASRGRRSNGSPTPPPRGRRSRRSTRRNSGALLEKADLQPETVRLIAAWKATGLADDLRKLAQDSKTSTPARFAAIDALARFGDKDSKEVLEGVAGPTFDMPLRFRAVAALARIDGKVAAQLGAKALAAAKETDDSSPIILEFLQRKKGAEDLADALAAQKISPDAAKVAIRAMYLAGKLDPKLNAVLSKYAGLDAAIKLPTAEEVRKIGDEALAKGDALRGERIFRRPDLGCIKCHAINKAGGNVGPDLGGVGSASPMDYIVQSILDPNASVKEEYLTKNIVTSAGQVITGIVVEKTKQYLVLKDAAGKRTKIATADIEEESKGRTLMPDGVTRILAHGELLDLIRFVSELGKPGPFAMPKESFVKTWKRLREVPVALADSAPHLEALRSGLIEQPATAFDIVPATLHGNVPLGELKLPGSSTAVVYLVSEIEVTRPGPLDVVFTGPAGTTAWVGDTAADKLGTVRVEAPGGRLRIIVRTTIADGANVRVELRKPADSTVQFELPTVAE